MLFQQYYLDCLAHASHLITSQGLLPSSILEATSTSTRKTRSGSASAAIPSGGRWAGLSHRLPWCRRRFFDRSRTRPRRRTDDANGSRDVAGHHRLQLVREPRNTQRFGFDRVEDHCIVSSRRYRRNVSGHRDRATHGPAAAQTCLREWAWPSQPDAAPAWPQRRRAARRQVPPR